MNDQTTQERDRHQFTGHVPPPVRGVWTCPGCGGNKAAGFAFCPRCHWRLPERLRKRCADSGSDEALADAMDFLVEHYGVRDQ